MSKNGLVKWVQSFDPYVPDQLQVRPGLHPIQLEESKTKTTFAKYALVAIVFFFLWASFAPLDGGVHIPGTVVVQGNRKAVQHPEGGVIEKILVHEGSVVKQGDVLVRINPLNLEAQLNAIDLDYINALVVESRLISERQGLTSIKWLSELDSFGDTPKVREAKSSQESIMRSRRQDLDGRINILSQEAAGLENQIRELGQLINVRKDQLKLLNEDVGNLKQLAAEGFVPQSKANELQRNRSDLIAGISTTTSDISKARSSMSEARLKILQEKSSFLKEVDSELSEVQKNRKAFKLNAESIKFDLSLADLKAPADGVVVGLQVFTEGGVIKGGEKLMDIVPQSERLIVHAKVPTDLIDKVKKGLATDLRFTAFNATTTPVIPGTVTLVGADKLMKSAQDDVSAPAEYYLAYVETTEDGLAQLGSHQVQAGMTVDVIVKTGQRTFMAYLLKPILDRFAVSFKEN